MKYFSLILGMALVTYLPRFIPLVVISKRQLNERFRLFLVYIPFTSLSILMARGVLTASSDMKIPTIVGVIVASLLAYTQKNVILSVVGGILAAFITINFLSF